MPHKHERAALVGDALEFFNKSNSAATMPFCVAPRKERNAMSDDFSWSDAADRDQVILREQPRTAIYLNPFNQIVIRQAADGFEESDPFVFFSVENVARRRPRNARARWRRIARHAASG